MTTSTNHTDTQRMSQLLLSRNMLLISAALVAASAVPGIEIIGDANTAWLFTIQFVGNPALNRLNVYVTDLETQVRLLICDLQSIPPDIPHSSVKPLHTLTSPFCCDPECICKNDACLVRRFVMQPLELHQISGNAAMAIYWGRAS